jgi:HB1, ASXL, restriction endonuclease HTH domain
MDLLDAALAVLKEEGEPLHWTVIQDLALKRGYIDPFIQKDIRKNLLAALSRAARQGRISKEGTGVYALRRDTE